MYSIIIFNIYTIYYRQYNNFLFIEHPEGVATSNQG